MWIRKKTVETWLSFPVFQHAIGKRKMKWRYIHGPSGLAQYQANNEIFTDLKKKEISNVSALESTYMKSNIEYIYGWYGVFLSFYWSRNCFVKKISVSISKQFALIFLTHMMVPWLPFISFRSAAATGRHHLEDISFIVPYLMIGYFF